MLLSLSSSRLQYKKDCLCCLDHDQQTTLDKRNRKLFPNELARLREEQQIVPSRLNTTTKGPGYFGEADQNQNNSKGSNSTAVAMQLTEAERCCKAAGCGCGGDVPRTYTYTR